MSKYHECPLCRHRITDVEFISCKYDYPCSGCNERNISEYHIREGKPDAKADQADTEKT